MQTLPLLDSRIIANLQILLDAVWKALKTIPYFKVFPNYISENILKDLLTSTGRVFAEQHTINPNVSFQRLLKKLQWKFKRTLTSRFGEVI